MNRRKFIQYSGMTFAGIAASGGIFHACENKNKNNRLSSPDKDNMKLFWGDIHNHCNITYGHGDIIDAFEAARQQLDFVSVTPHAMWPDIPGKGDPRLEWVIEYHEKAFEKLRKGGWDDYVKISNKYNRDGEFLTFLSYECHCMKYGDHVALNYAQDAPLRNIGIDDNPQEIFKDRKVFFTPHHMGYQEGYRGFDWKYFKEGKVTPFVEMFSRHGLAESDLGDYPYLHDMGPRRWEGTIQYGLGLGHKFGIIGSTDQHAGYPGSYGDGRVGVLSNSLSRDNIWNSLENRRVCCVTGDKIKVNFRINDAYMGDIIKAKSRKIYVHVEAGNAIDYIDVVKNGKTVGRISGLLIPTIPAEEEIRAKVKIEFGWNRFDEPVRWDGQIRIDKGVINGVETCFRGAAYTSPQKDKNGHSDLHVTKVNRLLSKTQTSVDLEMYSVKNPNVLTPATQAVILDVSMPKSGIITTDFNGNKFEHSLGTLLNGTQACFMNGWLSEAIQFHRAIPEQGFTVEHFMTDNEQENETDYYYVRVRQRDNQWAWTSPIWVERV